MVSNIDKQLQKIEQRLTRYECQKARYLYRTKQSASQFRKARTRTLIQLGGLVEKSGLLELLNITLGDDLQKDFKHQESTAILAGALAEIGQRCFGAEAPWQQIIWLERGKELLKKDTSI